MGFSLHEETEAATVAQTLGGIINGDLGHVRATPSRMWKIVFGFEYLLEAKVSPTLVQRAMTLCVRCRHGMSGFRALYNFVERDPPPPLFE